MQALANVKKNSGSLGKPAVSFGYYAELARSRDLNNLHRRISNVVKRLGFTDYSFIQLARADIPQTSLSTLPANLTRNYFDNNLFVHDMTLQKAIDSTETFFRSTVQDYISDAPFVSEMTKCMEQIYHLNKSYGYYDYFHIPAKSHASGSPIMLMVTLRGTSPIELKSKVQGCESALVLLCEAIDFVLTKYFPRHCYTSIKCTTINPKPLRVLETLANSDLTIEQVADKLNISVVTANQHLKTVRNSLGTRTNYAAIKRAVLEKFIRLDRCEDEDISDSNEEF